MLLAVLSVPIVWWRILKDYDVDFFLKTLYKIYNRNQKIGLSKKMNGLYIFVVGYQSIILLKINGLHIEEVLAQNLR